MSTLNSYRRYLQRLKERRNDPFYQNQASFLIRKTAPEYQRTAQQYETYLNREDLPESLKAQATINQQQNWANIIGGISGDMEMRESQRRQGLEGKIEEAEFQYDMAKEQKKEQDKDIFGNIISTVGNVAGTVASMIPGVGLPIGAAISTAGNAIGAAVSGSPQMQMQLINQAANEVVGGISASATLGKEKSVADDFLEVNSQIDNLNIDAGQKAELLESYKNHFMLGGSKEDFYTYLSDYMSF